MRKAITEDELQVLEFRVAKWTQDGVSNFGVWREGHNNALINHQYMELMRLHFEEEDSLNRAIKRAGPVACGRFADVYMRITGKDLWDFNASLGGTSRGWLSWNNGGDDIKTAMFVRDDVVVHDGEKAVDEPTGRYEWGRHGRFWVGRRKHRSWLEA